MLRKVAIFCLFVSLVNAASVSVTRCTAADSSCIKKSAQALIPTFVKGLPDLGVENLDPFTISETLDASTSGLKFLLKDMVVSGLGSCVVKKVQRDVEKMKLLGRIQCNVKSVGKYEMDGQLLILPVKGKGKIEVVLKKLVLNVDVDLSEKTGKDGKKHWDIKRFSHTYELLDKSDIDFENLFTGSEVLGRAASEVISNISNDIVLEVGPPVVKAITLKIVENVRKFFNHVPLDELVLE